MKELKGYKEARTMTESLSLPAGGYVVKIIDCSEEKTENGFEYLSFYYDVSEGENKDFYKLLYSADTDPEKKWKGILNFFVPNEKNEFYEKNLIKFKTMIANFEDNNPNFAWKWNEKDFKGCEVGIIYGNEEYQPKDSDDIIILSRPRFFTSAERIRKGQFKVPALKKLKKRETAENPFDAFEKAPADDEKLPWDN